jgi:hypothetical protein
MKNEAEDLDRKGKSQEHKSTRFIDWMFRSRTTGRIALVQVPNLPLVVWFLASAADRLELIEGQGRDVLGVVAAAALALWAVGEIVSGVNPFRRSLGLVVLLWMIVTRLGIG